MMSAQRYTEKFKVKAVNQVLDRGHWVAEVAQRLSDATLSSLALRARNVFTPCLHPFPQPLPRFYPPPPLCGTLSINLPFQSVNGLIQLL